MAEPFGKCCSLTIMPDPPRVTCSAKGDCGCKTTMEAPVLLPLHQGCDESVQSCAGSSGCSTENMPKEESWAPQLNYASDLFAKAADKIHSPILTLSRLAPSGSQSCSGRVNPVSGNLNLVFGVPNS